MEKNSPKEIKEKLRNILRNYYHSEEVDKCIDNYFIDRAIKKIDNL